MNKLLKIIGDIKKCIKNDAVPLDFSGGGRVCVSVDKIISSQKVKKQVEQVRLIQNRSIPLFRVH